MNRPYFLRNRPCESNSKIKDQDPESANGTFRILIEEENSV